MNFQKEKNTANNLEKIIFGIIFIIIGFVLLFFYIKTNQDFNIKKNSYLPITAEVVGYNYDPKGLEAIIVEYKINDQIYSKSSSDFMKNPLTIGTEVKIRYQKNDPSEAIWEEENQELIIPISGLGSILIGLVITTIGILSNNKNGTHKFFH